MHIGKTSLTDLEGMYFLFIGEVDPKERIARQRKLLQKKLGLNMGEAIGMSTEELFNDEDLDYTPTSAALVNKQSVGKTLGYLIASNNTKILLHFVIQVNREISIDPSIVCVHLDCIDHSPLNIA